MLKRREMMAGTALLAAGNLCYGGVGGTELPTRQRAKMFKTALLRAVRERVDGPVRRARIVFHLSNPLRLRRDRVLPMHGSYLVYSQCCAEMVSAGSVIDDIMSTVETIYTWILENWEKVLSILLSLLLFL